MPSNKPSILCTGPVDASMIEYATGKDVGLDIIPFTEIRPCSKEIILSQIQPLLQQKIVAVFTSANAVKPVVELLQGQVPDWTIFCIGFSTYESAKQIFDDEKIETVVNSL